MPFVASGALGRVKALTPTPLLLSRTNSGPSSRRGVPAQQVFNMDETGLQWKKMPEHTYITKEEKSAPGFKALKDCFTLLLGVNLTGDCKLKPVLVYHAKNPCALKGYDKNSLPVH